MNSGSPNKPGPKEVDAGSVYAFAHQAYWGFRFLAEKRETLWAQILMAATPSQVREVGTTCSRPEVMRGAGYGAAGMMTWLAEEKVALQVLSAKKHRRYPGSERPTSQDRRMIFLGIAVAAGIFGLSFNTALRKLAQGNMGIEHLLKEVHEIDRLHEMVESNGYVWAEPVGNYFWHEPDGTWTLLRELPCAVPKDWQGGYILYGYGPSGFETTFTRTLPIELTET
jgi:hypothetical protein